jgi:acetyl esterase/lipase
MTENIFYRRMFVSMLYIRVHVRSQTLGIPRQQKLFVTGSGLSATRSDLCQSSRRNQDQVRCRLTFPTGHKLPKHHFDQLLLHFHGGGFVSHSPDSHEVGCTDF